MLKMSILVHCYIDLHFQGHLLHELDDKTHCDHFGENLMKICVNGVIDIQRFFCFSR